MDFELLYTFGSRTIYRDEDTVCVVEGDSLETGTIETIRPVSALPSLILWLGLDARLEAA